MDITGTVVQPSIFLTFFLVGMGAGVAYIIDIVLRKFVKYKVVEIIVDFLYSISAGAVFLYEVYLVADGALRLYMLLGFISGIIIVRLIIKIVETVICRIKNNCEQKKATVEPVAKAN